MADALKITFAECPDLPYLPELPARGPYAGLIGRGTALLTGLGIDLQSAGWRLTDVSSRDHRRALATLRSDLDQLEEIAQGYEGPVKIAVAGPWTLAASLEHPRGDKVLPDTGARREVGQSLEQGIVDLVAELARRLPAITMIIQLDEPSLPAVLGGGIATASGLGRHRPVDIPEVSTAYTRLVERLGDTPVIVHCCAPGTPIELLATAGVTGLALDLGLLGTADWDALGVALEQGHWLLAGALPTTDPSAPAEHRRPGGRGRAGADPSPRAAAGDLHPHGGHAGLRSRRLLPYGSDHGAAHDPDRGRDRRRGSLRLAPRPAGSWRRSRRRTRSRSRPRAA